MTAPGRSVFVNDVSKEAEFLNDVYELADEIKIPKPLDAIELIDTDNIRKGKPFQVLVMERLNGYSLREFMEGKKLFPKTGTFC
jgi:hypothetical protein